MLPRIMNGTGAPGLRAGRLIDFGGDAAGGGRRLEEFAGILVDRPLPSAQERIIGPWEWNAINNDLDTRLPGHIDSLPQRHGSKEGRRVIVGEPLDKGAN
jgi:hypothetical protein